jgi:hypothetical protein
MTDYPSPLIVKNHPNLSSYHRLCWDFLTYLRDKENLKIHIFGYDKRQADTVDIFNPIYIDGNKNT